MYIYVWDLVSKDYWSNETYKEVQSAQLICNMWYWRYI